MLAYGAASFEEYPKLSHPSINFLTVQYTGLNLYNLVKLVSGLTFTLGSLTLICAVFHTVSSCFHSMNALFAVSVLLMKYIYIMTYYRINSICVNYKPFR